MKYWIGKLMVTVPILIPLSDSIISRGVEINSPVWVCMITIHVGLLSFGIDMLTSRKK